MSKTVVVVGVVALAGVGVFLYLRKRGSGTRGAFVPAAPFNSGPSLPIDAVSGVPSDIAQKRYGGYALATTSPADSVAAAAGNAYQRGSDIVAQGQAAVAAGRTGDVGGALSSFGSAVSGATSFVKNPLPQSQSSGKGGVALPAPKPAYAPPRVVNLGTPTAAQKAQVMANPQARTGHNRF